MASRIGINAAAQYSNSSTVKAFLRQLNPVAHLTMDGFTLCGDIASMLPQCIVISRDYSSYGGDDDLVNKISPQAWLDKEYMKGSPHIWRCAGNEMGFSDKVIQWYTDLIHYNLSKSQPLKLVIGNWSVGTPNDSDWPRAKELLTLASTHRDILIIGLHEYAAAVPTSGMYGGYPNHAGVDPNGADKDKGLNLIPFATWPSDTSGITLFHCGRFRFMVNYCKSIGLPPPRVILTEHGMDDVSDIKPFLDSLQRTPPYTNIRGFKTLFTQWQSWYSQIPGWTPERAYFEMLAYLDKHIYQGSCVEAQLLYTWSSKTDWQDFDISQSTGLQDALVSYAAANKPTPIPVQPPPPPPPPPPIPAPTPTYNVQILLGEGLTLEQAQKLAAEVKVTITEKGK